MPVVDKSQDAAFVSRTKKIIERAVRLRKKIREAADAVARQMEYGDALSKMGIDPGMIKKARLVKIVFGTVDNAVWDVPSDGRFMLTKTGSYVFGIALPSDYPAMLQFLKDYGFADKSADVSPVPLENLKKRAGNPEAPQ